MPRLAPLLAGMLGVMAVSRILSAASAAAALIPDPESFFVVPGAASTLRWKTAEPGPFPYVVHDVADGVVARGEAAVRDGAATASLQVPAGYYEIGFADGETFGVCALAPYGGRAPDPFFCLMGGLSIWTPEALRGPQARIAKRCGVAAVRELINWKAIEAEPGKWDWNPQFPLRSYDGTRKLYAAQGLPLLDFVMNPPAWLVGDNPYPRDLPAAAASWSAIASRWGGNWAGLETWNEPDIDTGGFLPADQYVPVAHALAYAWARDGRRAPLGGGVLARVGNLDFLSNAVRNGLLDDTDFFSFHTYTRAPRLRPQVAVLRQALAASPRGGLPLWITESGYPWPAGPARPASAADLRGALEIAMKAAEARAAGVARYFAFMLPFYEEKGKNYGMTDRDGTPLRSLAAYAQAIAALANRPFLGDLRGLPAEARLCPVFGGNGEGDAVAVLYTGEPNDGATVAFPYAVRRVAGIDGRSLPCPTPGAVPVPDGLAYVFVDPAAVAASLVPAPAAPAPPPPRPAPSPLVVQFVPDPKAMSADSGGYWLTQDEARHFPLHLRVARLDGPGAGTSAAATVVLHPLPDETRRLSVAPGQTAESDETADLTPLFAQGSRATLRVAASLEGAGAAASLDLDLRVDVPWADALRPFSRSRPLPLRDPRAWTPNLAKGGTMTLLTREGQPWRLDAAFPGVRDGWVFPYLALPLDLGLAGAAGLVLRGRCAQPGAVHVFLWKTPGKIGYLTPQEKSIFPPDGKWHTVFLPFDRFVLSEANDPDPEGRLDLAKIRTLSIGLSPAAPESSLEVSDAAVVWP